MTVGLAEPRAFWLPALGDRMGWLPWSMGDVRVSEYDRTLSYLQKAPF